MSYILDALRRADAERARGAVPDLHAQPLGFPPSPPRAARWRWPIAAVVALVLAAGTLGWLLASFAPGAGETKLASPQVALPPALPAASATPAPALAPPPSSGAPLTPASPPAQPQPPVVATALPLPATPASVTRPAVHARASHSAPRASTPAARTAAAAASASASASAPRVWRVGELPEDIRRDLPALRIGGSIGSADPANRLLIVDGQLLREGDEAAPGVHIREIRLKSAVVEFRSHRIELAF
jgi:general secretion pathway protein B